MAGFFYPKKKICKEIIYCYFSKNYIIIGLILLWLNIYVKIYICLYFF